MDNHDRPSGKVKKEKLLIVLCIRFKTTEGSNQVETQRESEDRCTLALG